MLNALTDLCRCKQLLHTARYVLKTAATQLTSSREVITRGKARAAARDCASLTYEEPPAREGMWCYAPLPLTILLIDDEPSFVSALARLLRHDGSTVDRAVDGHRALMQLHEHHYDVVLCDLRMPGLDRVEFYDMLRQHHAYLRKRVLFLTGDTLGAESKAFLEQSGQPWVYKPCNAANIRTAIRQLLQTV